MAIKVIRICDRCKKEYEQTINENQEEFICPIPFICSDCILTEVMQK